MYEIRLRILGQNDNLTLFTLKLLYDSKFKLGEVDLAFEKMNIFLEG